MKKCVKENMEEDRECLNKKEDRTETRNKSTLQEELWIDRSRVLWYLIHLLVQSNEERKYPR